MPARIRTTSMSSGGDRFTRQVWLLALNCLAACLLPLPGAQAGGAPQRPVPAVEASAQVPVALAAPAPVAGTWAGAPPGRSVPDAVGHGLHDAERLRAEHFCALYGCVSLTE
ncbi:MAG: hypothetical protein ACK4YP_12705 [Myxococcota bacterium]